MRLEIALIKPPKNVGGFFWLTRSISDAAFTQVIRRQLHRHFIPTKNSNVVLAHFSGDMGDHYVSVIQLYSELGIGQVLKNRAFHLYMFFFCHTRNRVRYFLRARSIPKFAILDSI